MMSNYGLRAAAFCEQAAEYIALKWALFIRRFLMPLLLWRGRDMVLLNNGMWVDASPNYEQSEITWHYDSITHRLTNGSGPGPMTRWKWLGATARGRDMGDFFSELRISRGGVLPDAKVVELFIHQKGWNPGNQIQIIDRITAEESVIWLTGGGARESAAPASAPTGARELDYIR